MLIKNFRERDVGKDLKEGNFVAAFDKVKEFNTQYSRYTVTFTRDKYYKCIIRHPQLIS